MKYDPAIHHRRSIRLQGHDYSRAGVYFVTMCTHDHACLFGAVVDREMRMNAAGRIVADEWLKTAESRDEIEWDDWVVMPNHFHGILLVVNRKGTARRAPAMNREQFGKPVSGSVPTIVRAFKSAVTKRINAMRGTPGAKLWQRNYWEHVIRNESEWNRIREYIRNNPGTWESDRLNEHARTTDRSPLHAPEIEVWMV